MSRLLVALIAIAAVAGGGVASGAGAAPPSATQSTATKPPIHKMLIPYPKKRKREMAAYSKHHYGQYKWRLTDPHVIVIHYAVAGSISAIYNTFAPDRPDVQFHELPNVCSQFAVAASGAVYKFVPPTIRCRHTVGLNYTAIGVEHVGFSDQDILNRPAQLNGSLQFVQWLRCRYGIPISDVIGHNESLSSPFYKELDPRFQGQTHSDWNHADMQIYRSDLAKLGSC
ncbi:MAG TPA: peptidoglycan recognition family protein [Candidatus Eisenbacteria bacterium]|nr:peptidoglycan recognition family protein [Candidatus Eisenbacteria bacterium]